MKLSKIANQLSREVGLDIISLSEYGVSFSIEGGYNISITDDGQFLFDDEVNIGEVSSESLRDHADKTRKTSNELEKIERICAESLRELREKPTREVADTTTREVADAITEDFERQFYREMIERSRPYGRLREEVEKEVRRGPYGYRYDPVSGDSWDYDDE